MRHHLQSHSSDLAATPHTTANQLFSSIIPKVPSTYGKLPEILTKTIQPIYISTIFSFSSFLSQPCEECLICCYCKSAAYPSNNDLINHFANGLFLTASFPTFPNAEQTPSNPRYPGTRTGSKGLHHSIILLSPYREFPNEYSLSSLPMPLIFSNFKVMEPPSRSS